MRNQLFPSIAAAENEGATAQSKARTFVMVVRRVG